MLGRCRVDDQRSVRDLFFELIQPLGHDVQLFDDRYQRLLVLDREDGWLVVQLNRNGVVCGHPGVLSKKAR